ncbi:MAG: translation elongation factor Ts [Flavobacteriales bacterium AspAUS03]
MYQATALKVNALRKKSGAGMMDCKKALIEAAGDVDKAIELLRKKGQKIAASSGRETNQGAVIAKVNASRTLGIIINLSCETDFVAKNENFVKLANDLAEKAIFCDTREALLNTSLDGISVQDKLIEQTGIICEKITLSAFKKLQAPFVSFYIHMRNKIATLVGFSAAPVGVEDVAKDVAMQIAAMNPLSLNEKDIPTDLIEKELEIIKEQLRKEGKSEQILDQIAQGKLKKFFSENTLVHQSFIKDHKISVADYVRNFDPNLKIVDFRRLSI